MNKIILAFAAITIGSAIIVATVAATHVIWYFAIFSAMIGFLVTLALTAAVHGLKLLG
jgi:hypothetical protein